MVESRRRLKELVGKLVVAQEEERRKVAYEVHDGLTQTAVAVHQNLQHFAAEHPAGSVVERGELDRVLELAQRTVREARHVIEGLRPTVLDDFGLAAALRLQVDEMRADGWEVGYEESLGERRLGVEVEAALFRVAQEALNNARKHAGTTKARVRIGRRGGAFAYGHANRRIPARMLNACSPECVEGVLSGVLTQGLLGNPPRLA